MGRAEVLKCLRDFPRVGMVGRCVKVGEMSEGSGMHLEDAAGESLGVAGVQDSNLTITFDSTVGSVPSVACEGQALPVYSREIARQIERGNITMLICPDDNTLMVDANASAQTFVIRRSEPSGPVNYQSPNGPTGM